MLSPIRLRQNGRQPLNEKSMFVFVFESNRKWEFVGVDGCCSDCRAQSQGAAAEPFINSSISSYRHIIEILQK